MTSKHQVNIDELPAGPELDALVAEKVMGWYSNELVWCDKGGSVGYWVSDEVRFREGGHWPAFHPSTDIKAAWEVVENLKSLSGIGGWFSIEVPSGDIVRAGFQSHLGHAGEWRHRSNATSAPLAICRAALKTVEAMV